MRLLVTGSGRCGTTWLARCLRAAGIPAGHEKAFNLTRHGGPFVAECAWQAAPYTPVPDCWTVHLVRHPLATIRSRLSWGTFRFDDPAVRPVSHRLGRWAIQVCPEIGRWPTALERTAQHWVSWNRLVRADRRVRLEDLNLGQVNRICRIVDPDAHLDGLPPPALPSPPSGPVTWDQVAHIPGLAELAEEYGYR
jgi:hypothetical protein